nr:putative ribonuclease H protein At1g65750 family [Tanacetum cinerariifolium]
MIAWVAWEKVTAEKERGGLDIGSLASFNLTLLQKWRWHFFYDVGDLWCNVIKAIHGEYEGLDSREISRVKIGCRSGETFRSDFKLSHGIGQGIHRFVGGGGVYEVESGGGVMLDNGMIVVGVFWVVTLSLLVTGDEAVKTGVMVLSWLLISIMGEVVSILTSTVVSVMSVLVLTVRNSALVLLMVANSCTLSIVSSSLISLSLAVDAASCSLCKVLVAISFATFLAMKAMDSLIDGGIVRWNESTIDNNRFEMVILLLN